MKIGIFLGSVGSNSGGPERYETELIRHLAKIDTQNEYELFCLFKDAPARLQQQSNFRTHVLKPHIRTVSMLTSLPRAMSRCPADVWHATYVPPPLSPRDYLFTLVCSSMIERPELYPPAIRYRLVALTNRAIKKSQHIICISEHIKQVVQERYKVSEDRLSVTHLGVSDTFKPFDNLQCRQFVQQAYGIDRPYFLFSGRWEPRKNIVRIIKAFAQFKKETGSELLLVFSGARTWAAEEAEQVIDANNLRSEVVDLGKSPVEELPQLYSGATALVYPSLWEGFGLPIVEGMAAGIPVITSNNSSMAEIGADAALLVDPLSEADIAEAMYRVVYEPNLHHTLVAKSLQRAGLFRWEDTAKKTLQIYQHFGSPLGRKQSA